jgi:hypothetical protein
MLMDAVREVLKTNGEAMSPAQITEYIITTGRYKTSIAEIQNTVKKLHNNNEARKLADLKTGKPSYQWLTEEERKQRYEEMSKRDLKKEAMKK